LVGLNIRNNIITKLGVGLLEMKNADKSQRCELKISKESVLGKIILDQRAF
jgi:hypothetical protein